MQVHSLPPYTARELGLDRGIHGAGITLGVLGAISIVIIAADRNGKGRFFAILVYSLCLVAMLGCSAAYNLARPSPRREMLRRFDHAAIFLMIAGTYTPFTAAGLFGIWSRPIVLVVWTVAVAGTALKLFFPRRVNAVSVILYLMLGWIGLIALRPLLASLDPATIILLGAGGVLYSGGVGFHLWQRLPFHNAVWHGFVLVAAACQYAAVMRGVVLAAGH